MFASLLGAAFPLTRVPSSHALRRTVKSLIGETKVQYYTHFDFRPAPADQPPHGAGRHRSGSGDVRFDFCKQIIRFWD